jgi:hypothetical protein
MDARSGGAARRHLFVYYKVPADAVPNAAAAAQRAQQRLADRHPGLQAALLQRPEPGADDTRTVMETYDADPAHWPEGITRALQAEIETVMREALAPWLAASARHLEVFIDLPCAS